MYSQLNELQQDLQDHFNWGFFLASPNLTRLSFCQKSTLGIFQEELHRYAGKRTSVLEKKVDECILALITTVYVKCLQISGMRENNLHCYPAEGISFQLHVSAVRFSMRPG